MPSASWCWVSKAMSNIQYHTVLCTRMVGKRLCASKWLHISLARPVWNVHVDPAVSSCGRQQQSPSREQLATIHSEVAGQSDYLGIPWPVQTVSSVQEHLSKLKPVLRFAMFSKKSVVVDFRKRKMQIIPQWISNMIWCWTRPQILSHVFDLKAHATNPVVHGWVCIRTQDQLTVSGFVYVFLGMAVDPNNCTVQHMI